MSREVFSNQPDSGPNGTRVQIVGVGGAGLHAVEHLAQSGFAGVPLAAVHTDARLLAQSSLATNVLLGSRLTRGLKAGDPDVGRAIAEGETEQLAELCSDVDLLLLVVGLGGSTGSGVAPVLARVAREAGVLVLAVATLPFDLEGRRRGEQAQIALRELRTASDAVILLPNQQVVRLLEEGAGLTEALEKVNELLADGLRGLCRLVTQAGLIKVDFSDLCEVVRGRHSESCLAAAEAAGEDRVKAVVERLLNSPFLDHGNALSEAESVLVSIAGGPGLSLKEIQQLMDQVNRLCEQAQVVMGADVDPVLGDRLVVTLVGTHRRQGEPAGSEPTEADVEPGLPGAEFPVDGRAGAEPTSGGAARARHFVPPAPQLAPEEKVKLMEQRGLRPKRGKRAGTQFMLPLEVVSKERFEQSEPTRYRGEDLDTPTFIRRGVRLN
ncbi:MAG: cell division FtsZ family protein [Verrucomicrobiae bacterium]|nr:cell division FtsZ family protein [Verrucomicrobiae bacterium]